MLNNDPNDKVYNNCPKKLYRGKKRLCRFWLQPHTKKIFNWALSVKPGDYIFSHICNEKVTCIKFIMSNEGHFRRCKSNKTWFLFEVVFVLESGGYVYCDTSSEVGPAVPVEQLKKEYDSLGVDVTFNEFGRIISGRDLISPENYEEIRYRIKMLESYRSSYVL